MVGHVVRTVDTEEQQDYSISWRVWEGKRDRERSITCWYDDIK